MSSKQTHYYYSMYEHTSSISLVRIPTRVPGIDLEIGDRYVQYTHIHIIHAGYIYILVEKYRRCFLVPSNSVTYTIYILC